jgi:hypothetical protein
LAILLLAAVVVTVLLFAVLDLGGWVDLESK